MAVPHSTAQTVPPGAMAQFLGNVVGSSGWFNTYADAKQVGDFWYTAQRVQYGGGSANAQGGGGLSGMDYGPVSGVVEIHKDAKPGDHVRHFDSGGNYTHTTLVTKDEWLKLFVLFVVTAVTLGVVGSAAGFNVAGGGYSGVTGLAGVTANFTGGAAALGSGGAAPGVVVGAPIAPGVAIGTPLGALGPAGAAGAAAGGISLSTIGSAASGALSLIGRVAGAVGSVLALTGAGAGGGNALAPGADPGQFDRDSFGTSDQTMLIYLAAAGLVVFAINK